ncbi:uncharacterized protein LOC133187532 [Saccostrea echinata]|uniref:uncharacterized protein LOC133187532 n=1 Tax=Saccostrea echinata TaxID=191078 RepID=UPI002A83993A|nr:uncharacterized protein LOC133187532 [Saccostrea echinata]
MSAYNCSDPSSISNGYYVVDKTYYVDGDQVYFVCHSSYTLNGNPVFTCDGTTGNWSGTYPTCSSTTTTTAAPDYEEWLYVGIGVISFIGLILLLILLLLFLKYCLRLCRKWSRVSALHGINEQVEIGCCYACCTRCCLKCWSCCQESGDVINETGTKSKAKQVPKQNYTSSNSNSVSVISEETVETSVTPSLIKREVKPARELNTWMPHTHGVRNNNTSTK